MVIMTWNLNIYLVSFICLSTAVNNKIYNKAFVIKQERRNAENVSTVVKCLMQGDEHDVFIISSLGDESGLARELFRRMEQYVGAVVSLSKKHLTESSVLSFVRPLTYIAFSDIEESLTTGLRSMEKYRNWNHQSLFVVVTSADDAKIRIMYQYFLRSNVIRAFVINIQGAHHSVLSYNPYHDGTEDRLRYRNVSRMVTSKDGSKQVLNSLRPATYDEIVVSVSPTSPMVYFYAGAVRGFDGLLLESVCRVLGSSMRLVFPTGEQNMGSRSPDSGQFGGALAAVVSGEAQVHRIIVRLLELKPLGLWLKLL